MDTHNLLEQVEAILDALDAEFLPHRPMKIRRRKSIIAVAKAMAQGSNYREVLGKHREKGLISKRVFFEAKKPYWHARPVREAITAVAEVYAQYYTAEQEQREAEEREAKAAEREADRQRRKDRRERILDAVMAKMETAVDMMEAEELADPRNLDRMMKNAFAQERAEFGDVDTTADDTETVEEALWEAEKAVDIDA